MADKRKLLGDIDRTLKRVQEGRLAFQEILDKFEASANHTQKEKFEGDLKKEIKKLQRLRDQIKTWLTSNEVKDKRSLLEARKEIEQDMERFKVIEKETKTKAYSKEGLSAADSKRDPAQKEKEELEEWLKQSISSLQTQAEKYEFDIESLTTSNKKKRIDKEKASIIEDKKQRLNTCNFHIEKLETLMRHLDNQRLDCEKVRSIKFQVEYVVESVEDQPNNVLTSYGNMYDDLHLDELGDTTGLAPGLVPSFAEHEGAVGHTAPSTVSRNAALDVSAAVVHNGSAPSASTHTSINDPLSGITPITAVSSNTNITSTTTSSSTSSNASSSRERSKVDDKLSHTVVNSTSTPIKSTNAIVIGGGKGSKSSDSSSIINQSAPPAILSQNVSSGPYATTTPNKASSVGRSFVGSSANDPSITRVFQYELHSSNVSTRTNKSESTPNKHERQQKTGKSITANQPSGSYLQASERTSSDAESCHMSETIVNQKRSGASGKLNTFVPASTLAIETRLSTTITTVAQPQPSASTNFSQVDTLNNALISSVAGVDNLNGPANMSALSAAAVAMASAAGGGSQLPLANVSAMLAQQAAAVAAASGQTPLSLVNAAMFAMAQMKASQLNPQAAAAATTGSSKPSSVSVVPLTVVDPLAGNQPTGLDVTPSGVGGPAMSGKLSMPLTHHQVAQSPHQNILSQQPMLLMLNSHTQPQQQHLSRTVVGQPLTAATQQKVLTAQPQSQHQLLLRNPVVTQMHPRDAAAPFRNRNLDKVARLPEALENGFRRLPHSCDTEKSRMIVCKNLVNGPSYYPREPLRATEAEEYYAKLDAQTLFFIFYYFEGTLAQYLAAKALKRMSWRFHTKFMMWFQRHEEPKQITDEYESGTYIYYDFKTMCQRKKEEFVFHYTFLEDKDF